MRWQVVEWQSDSRLWGPSLVYSSRLGILQGAYYKGQREITLPLQRLRIDNVLFVAHYLCKGGFRMDFLIDLNAC
jgi:hypothetical protein